MFSSKNSKCHNKAPADKNTSLLKLIVSHLLLLLMSLVCYVQIVEHLNVEHLPPEETSRHVVRVGFSTDANSLQLGETISTCFLGRIALY